MSNQQGGVRQSVGAAAGAVATAVASSAQWGWDAIFGTVPGWEFETVFAGFAGPIGCGAAIIGLILLVVVAIALFAIFTSSPTSTSFKQTKALTVQPTGQNVVSPSGSADRSRSDAIAGASVDSNAKSQSPLEFEADLQRKRLQAIADGMNAAEYQKLLAEQRQEYADRGLDPCASDFFPAEACAGAGDNEKPQGNPPPTPPVSTPANPPPPELGPSGDIKISRQAYQHVVDGHTVGGAESQGNSIFNQGENIIDLIKQAESTEPTKQPFGNNYERIVDAGRTIGIDRATGQPTSVYTVITDSQGNLVTAFPGTP